MPESAVRAKSRRSSSRRVWACAELGLPSSLPDGTVVGRCGPLDMGKRDEDQTIDVPSQADIEQVGKPLGVGLRKEALGARRKENSGEVNHGVDAFQGPHKRRRTCEVCRHDAHVGRCRQVSGNLAAVHHQSQGVFGTD